MNELIEKLWNDAALHGDSWDTQRQFIHKFAQLIVDECCLKLLDMDEKTKGNHNYYKHAALEIKKHFGVKE